MEVCWEKIENSSYDVIISRSKINLGMFSVVGCYTKTFLGNRNTKIKIIVYCQKEK